MKRQRILYYLAATATSLDYDKLREVCYWYNGEGMKTTNVERFIEGFKLIKPLAPVTSQTLWRNVPIRAIKLGKLVPNKALSSWSETEEGARYFAGAVAGTVDQSLVTARIPASQIMCTNSHIQALIRLLDAQDNPDADRLWNAIHSVVLPHTYQREVVVYDPRLHPVTVIEYKY